MAMPRYETPEEKRNEAKRNETENLNLAKPPSFYKVVFSVIDLVPLYLSLPLGGEFEIKQ